MDQGRRPGTEWVASGAVLEQHWVPRNELEALGLAFVQAYNARDIEAGLALADPDVIALPSRITGAAAAEGYRGHEGVREWWQLMADRKTWYQVLVSAMQVVERRAGDRRGEPRSGPFPGAGSGAARRGRALGEPPVPREGERRQTDASKLAIFGEMLLDGESLTPWATVLIIRNGLILRQRSYLSTRELLSEIGVVEDPGA